MNRDAELLARWREGDSSAGQDLFERYFEPVSRFFSNKVTHDHEDLIQETFAACVRGRDRIRSDGSFRSYLFSTAFNVLKVYFRRKAGGRAGEDLETYTAADLAPGPSTLLRAGEQEMLLLEALRCIPLELQVAFEMKYWEGMNSAEIGEALGIPRGTVRSRMRRGRDLLEKALAQLSTEPRSPTPSDEDLEQWAQRIRALMDAQKD